MSDTDLTIFALLCTQPHAPGEYYRKARLAASKIDKQADGMPHIVRMGHDKSARHMQDILTAAFKKWSRLPAITDDWNLEDLAAKADVLGLIRKCESSPYEGNKRTVVIIAYSPAIAHLLKVFEQEMPETIRYGVAYKLT